MEERNIRRHPASGSANSNIIFGTSSDDIQQGLDQNQFVEEGGDEDQVVNEQEQHEIVNPSEETFNEEPAPKSLEKDNLPVADQQTPTQLEENVIDLDTDKNDIDKAGKVSKAED